MNEIIGLMEEGIRESGDWQVIEKTWLDKFHWDDDKAQWRDWNDEDGMWVKGLLYKNFPGGYDEFARTLTNGHLGGKDVSLDLYKASGYVSWGKLGYDNILMRIQWRYGNPRLKKELNIGELSIRDQREGTARSICQGVYEVCKRMGLEGMGLGARAKGHYAWARIGFVPELSDWQRIYDNVENLLKQEEMKSGVPDKHGIMDRLNREDPYSLWDLVDGPRGKQLILKKDNFWSGDIKLNDSRAVSRLFSK